MQSRIIQALVKLLILMHFFIYEGVHARLSNRFYGVWGFPGNVTYEVSIKRILVFISYYVDLFSVVCSFIPIIWWRAVYI